MFKPLEIFIGLRYTGAKRRNHFISFISLSSMIGIALGVTALITVLSVMNGFENELKRRILSMTAHATISDVGGRLKDWQTLDSQVGGFEQILATAPYIQGEGMLTQGSRVQGTIIRGVVPSAESKVSQIATHMEEGALADLKPGEFGIVLGRELALQLRAFVGDKVTLITPQASVTPAGVMPRLRRFTVVGIFRIDMNEYDSGLAVIHLADAQKLFQYGKSVSGLRLMVKDLLQASWIAKEVGLKLGEQYRVEDWTQTHKNFFAAVRMEKTVMFVILALIVAVAAFNIVSTLVMLVTDKQSDIAILRTIGATPASIMGIFMVQGMVIGVIGTMIGLAGGLSLAANVETIVQWIERTFGVQFLSADIYYISELPSEILWSDVTSIAALSLVLSFFATIYPAWRAARTEPAEALRYE